MAERIFTGGAAGSFGGLSAVYFVETPVGSGADNKVVADVQLVQVFLRHFYQLNPAVFKKLPKPGGKNVSEILLDGKVGQQTIAGIAEFQKFVIKSGAGGQIVDGRVSVPHGGLRVAGTKHVFTNIQLNVFFFNTSAENKSFNDNLEEHPVVRQLPLLVADIIRKRA